MSELLPVRLGDNHDIYIETARPTVAAEGKSKIREARKPGTLQAVSEQAVDASDQFTSAIKTLSGRVAESINDMPSKRKPVKAAIEFGLSVSAEGNVFVVKGTADATITVSLEWDLTRDQA